MPTIQLNWLQPHEGNIVEFLFRAARIPDGVDAVPPPYFRPHRASTRFVISLEDGGFSPSPSVCRISWMSEATT